MNKSLAGLVLFTGVLLCGGLRPAGAAMVIDIVDQGLGTVEITAYGTVNLAATVNYIGAESSSGYVWPTVGTVAVGSGMADVYGLAIFEWAPLGPGDLASGGSGAGDVFGTVGDTLSFQTAIAVPAGYVSGSLIIGSVTLTGSLASLGLVPGTYETPFSFEGNSDSVTINVIPEPGAASLLLLGGVAYLARRRARSSM